MQLMSKLLAAYITTLLTMVLIDLVWLGVIARPWYLQGIGHLMAERPNVPVAVLFYAVFALGLMVFAVAPQSSVPGWRASAAAAAMFGFFCYATYDLTNLATLKDWPVWLAALDMAWGVFVSVASAVAGKAMLDRWPFS